MKDAEDEAFDELAKRQGHWGGGYQAKRQMAADKLQEPTSGDYALGYAEGFNDACKKPAQEPVAWDNCRSENQCRGWCGNSACGSHWQDTTPPKREWVGLTDEERQDIALEDPMDAVFITEVKLKKRNHGT